MIELKENESLYTMDVAGRTIYGITHFHAHAEERYFMVVMHIAGKFCKRIEEFLAKYAPGNIIAFGVRGGDLDEHPPYKNEEERKRKKDASALTLLVGIFKEEFAFDVETIPTMKAAIRHLLDKDSHATASALDITKIIKEMNRYPEYSDEEIMAWACQGFLAKFHEDPNSPELANFDIDHIRDVMKGLREIFPDPDAAENWHSKAWVAHKYSHEKLHKEAVKEYSEKVKQLEEKEWRNIKAYFKDNPEVEGLRMPIKMKRSRMSDRIMPLVFIRSDNIQIAPHSRSYAARKAHMHAAVLIQQNSKRQYFIASDGKEYGTELGMIVALLRNAVRVKKGLRPLQMNNPALYEPGSTEDVPEIFFMRKDTQSIMNGSETHRHIASLPLEPYEIILIVLRGIREIQYRY